VKLALSVNGEPREVDVPPNTTLLSVLRDDLDLTGTRYGCGRGQCGACFVIADNRAVASCLLTADQAARMEITTIEGLAGGEKLHPVQEAFVREDAMQCGYCTSGMVISATALLERLVPGGEVVLQVDSQRALRQVANVPVGGDHGRTGEFARGGRHCR